MAEAKWSGVLSTTEPRNDVGIIKVRQGNVNSEVAEFQIVQNNKPYNLTGLTVYFCASFGLNLVEKPAVIVNAAGGRIQYTFDDDSMQSLGRQKGYFSIKKEESKIDSTQDFEYQVESSLMTRSIDGKSYIYNLSALIKILDDFVKNGQKNFNTWFDSVKEILYGVDPGGNILRELIEARKNSSGNIFTSLKERLDKNEDETNRQLAQTKPIKFLEDIPTISDLPEGVIGVLTKEEVKLKILNSIPLTGDENIKCHTPIFVDFNMPIDKSTITTSSVRILEGTTNVVMLRGYDSVNKRIFLYPTPQLDPQKTYVLEITDGLRSTKGYSIGGNSKHTVVFKTGGLTSMRINDSMNDYTQNWAISKIGTPAIVQEPGLVRLKVNPGQEIIMTALEGTPTGSVDYVLKPVNTPKGAIIQLRLTVLGKRHIISLRKGEGVQGVATDFLESNIVNKQRLIDMSDFIHVKISRKESGTVNAWVNGFEFVGIKESTISGGRLEVVLTAGSLASEWELHHVLAPLEYEEV